MRQGDLGDIPNRVDPVYWSMSDELRAAAEYVCDNPGFGEDAGDQFYDRVDEDFIAHAKKLAAVWLEQNK